MQITKSLKRGNINNLCSCLICVQARRINISKTLKHLEVFIISFKHDNIHKFGILLSEEHTYSFTTSYHVGKHCIVVNGEKISKSFYDLDLGLEMTKVQFQNQFHILQCF